MVRIPVCPARVTDGRSSVYCFFHFFPGACGSHCVAFPHMRVFFPGSWSSVEFLFLFHENMVLPLGWSHSSCGVYLLVSSALCAVLPCSARESAASLRGSPLWSLILMRKVLAPAVTLSWRICTISRTISPSGVVSRFARVPSPTHLLMVLRRDSLSVR